MSPKMIGYQEQVSGLVLIAEDTSGGSSVEFDIPAGYTFVEWHFANLHPANSSVSLQFQVNASGGSGFNETITSTHFQIYHNEADSDSAIAYSGGNDQGNGTSYQPLFAGLGNDNDNNAGGVFTLYAPSSTTYVKHFTSDFSFNNGTYATEAFTGGYINTTSAIAEIDFKFGSGNIDAGTIRMYGVR